jgi:hypothetical protein
LRSGPELVIEALAGAAAAQTLIENTYRGRQILVGGDPRLHWEACVRLASRRGIFTLVRPWSLLAMENTMAEVLPHVLSVVRQSDDVGSTPDIRR